MFLSERDLRSGTWQAFVRAVARLLVHEGFTDIRLVDQPGDRGADLLAHRGGKRWLFQVKHWRQKAGVEVADQVLQAMRTYRAHVPVIVALNGFDDSLREHHQVLLSRGVPLQLWDCGTLVSRARRLSGHDWVPEPREYQKDAIEAIVRAYTEGHARRAMIVMATGLGKTFVACEAIRRLNAFSPVRVLAIAHTNELVYQLERAFWPFLKQDQATLVWNQYEQPIASDLLRVPFIFACLNTVAAHVKHGGELPPFDIILVDECHHVGAEMYRAVLEETRAGKPGGPFLVGLTATPWRPDDVDLREYFGDPLVCVDIVTGLKKGFLSNVDYRMYTDNIKWEALKNLRGSRFSPKQINRTLFINEWDDAVVHELGAAWGEQPNPRAIVFCGTIDHAITMRDRINAFGFCNAAAIYSGGPTGRTMPPAERNRILSDFHDGIVGVVCAVDIFNEGIDVPEVNIIVFQRVTHSRRIFVQQLGRGLRIAPGKEKVIVLDFVSDIRRFAAGLELKDSLSAEPGPGPGNPVRISLPHKVTFRRVGGEDPETESFLREWLEDIAAVESAGEDASILKFPPELPGGRR
ncbi:MAG: DEAD/DEAH box helicase family protein [Bacillota bacterium]